MKSRPTQKLIGLQLNELNFEYIERYVTLGHLPVFGSLLEQHGCTRTISESAHELVNPWIQWPTVHTGLDYADHGVFRTGDIVKTDFDHIYEVLERNGHSVAAMSPFNANNNTSNASFFVPDPWTETRFDGPWTLRLLYDALVDVANDYAKNRISLKSFARLLTGLVVYGKPSSAFSYVRDSLAYFAGHTWSRALVCDRLIMDAFLKEWRKHRPDYSTVFVTGAAHLQHHYLFSSQVYDGEKRNPSWLIADGVDPLLAILKVYDDFLGRLVALGEDVRLMISTGLHQEPHERETYYYRIDDLSSTLQALGLTFTRAYPLMTEDFVVCFKDEAAASEGERLLAAVCTIQGENIFYRETGDCAVRTLEMAPNLFHIENRGSDLYIQLKPTCSKLPEHMTVSSGDTTLENFERRVSFAQYKNANHLPDGYFLDTGVAKADARAEMPLRELYSAVLDVFEIE